MTRVLVTRPRAWRRVASVGLMILLIVLLRMTNRLSIVLIPVDGTFRLNVLLLIV